VLIHKKIDLDITTQRKLFINQMKPSPRPAYSVQTSFLNLTTIEKTKAWKSQHVFKGFYLLAKGVLLQTASRLRHVTAYVQVKIFCLLL